MVIRCSKWAVGVSLFFMCIFGVSAVAIASGTDVVPVAVEATNAVSKMNTIQLMAAITLSMMATLVATVYFFVKFITVFFKQIVVALNEIKAALPEKQ